MDKITVFAVNVTNAKVLNVSDNVNAGPEALLEVKDFVPSDKSLKILMLCANCPRTKKEMLISIGVTNQTNNARNIINPLISAGCVAPIDQERIRNMRFEITGRGWAYLSYQSSLVSGSELEHQACRFEDNDPQLFPDYE